MNDELRLPTNRSQSGSPDKQNRDVASSKEPHSKTLLRRMRVTPSARSWSAAVLCRFRFFHLEGLYRSLASYHPLEL
jgi:hypothetical protein